MMNGKKGRRWGRESPSVKRPSQSKGERETKGKELSWVSLACHPSVITTPCVKQKETERQRKWKSNKKKKQEAGMKNEDINAERKAAG